MMPETVNIICLKWGNRYPAFFVNRLYASVKRHMHRPFRFVCFTEDPTGLTEGIETAPLPENPNTDIFPVWPDIFIKLCLFKDGLAGLKGPTMFMDLDITVQQDIDCFFDYEPGKNCIIHNWVERRKMLFRKRPDIGNSSCFRFEAGKSQWIYDTFVREMKEAVRHDLYATEQAFMTHAFAGKYAWWPEEWVRSFKRTCIPVFPLNLFVTPKKPDTKILVFHGLPDPDQAVAGFKGKKRTSIHQRVKPCKWILEDWHE